MPEADLQNLRDFVNGHLVAPHRVEDCLGLACQLFGGEISRFEAVILLAFTPQIVLLVGAFELLEEKKYAVGGQMLRQKFDLISPVRGIHLEGRIFQHDIEAGGEG